MYTAQATALYGGTFNPVHKGHLRVARTVCDRLNVSSVRMVLAARPPHRRLVPWQDRWAMLQLACAEDRRLVPDDRELHRARLSYTVDTLLAERRRRPIAPLYWVVGMDSLNTFTSWYRWWRILELAHLVVLRRPGYPLRLPPRLARQVRRRVWPAANAAWQRRHDGPPGLAGRIVLLPDAMLAISASGVRAGLAEGGLAGRQALEAVPPEVAGYIQQHNLYAPQKTQSTAGVR